MEAIPELLHLRNEELNDLLECDDKLQLFIESLPDVAAILNRCQQLAEKNYVLANENLKSKINYEKTRDDTIKKVEELTSLHEKFDKLTIEHQQLSAKLAPSNIQELTLIAAAQSEEESEMIAEEFLQKNIEINAFLHKYSEKRVESHLRKFKGDRLGTQLKELQKAGF